MVSSGAGRVVCKFEAYLGGLIAKSVQIKSAIHTSAAPTNSLPPAIPNTLLCFCSLAYRDWEMDWHYIRAIWQILCCEVGWRRAPKIIPQLSSTNGWKKGSSAPAYIWMVQWRFWWRNSHFTLGGSRPPIKGSQRRCMIFIAYSCDLELNCVSYTFTWSSKACIASSDIVLWRFCFFTHHDAALTPNPLR